MPASAIVAALLACQLVATDGDTLRCGAERIRLSGIDAPEFGRCPPRRRCAPGDPYRSKALLAAQLGGPALIYRLGVDHYGRTIATVIVGGVDLSCQQLRAKAAIYKIHWDNQRAVARQCPGLAK